MGDVDTRIGGPAGAFPSTRDSVLASLGHSARDPDFERLISLYWKPVYCLIRRLSARTNEDAKDLTQEFFVRIVLQGDLADRYTPDKGTFRAYLRTSVRNFVRNEHRDGSRLKRGGDAAPVSLEIRDFDVSEVLPDAHAVPPDQLFDAAWRSVVLAKAVELVRERLVADGRSETFEVFRRYDLEDDGAQASYDSVGRALGIGPDAVKNHLTRAREEFRTAVRSVVCATVTDSKDLTSELRELFGL